HIDSRSLSAYFFLIFFFLMLRRPLTSTLFPYTTLFRSWPIRGVVHPGWPAGARRSTGAPGLADESPSGRSRARGRIRCVIRGRRSEEHTSELQSLRHLVCRLLLEKKKKKQQ